MNVRRSNIGTERAQHHGKAASVDDAARVSGPKRQRVWLSQKAPGESRSSGLAGVRGVRALDLVRSGLLSLPTPPTRGRVVFGRAVLHPATCPPRLVLKGSAYKNSPSHLVRRRIMRRNSSKASSLRYDEPPCCRLLRIALFFAVGVSAQAYPAVAFAQSERAGGPLVCTTNRVPASIVIPAGLTTGHFNVTTKHGVMAPGTPKATRPACTSTGHAMGTPLAARRCQFAAIALRRSPRQIGRNRP